MPITAQERRVESLRTSPNYTAAQRVRQKHMQRRRLKNDRGLSAFRAVLETYVLIDEVGEDMLTFGADEKLFTAVVVRHRDGEFLKFRTIVLDPTPDGIGKVMREIAPLTEVKVLGCIFRLYDSKAGVSRDWGRPFVPGEDTRKILLRVLREQSKQEGDEMLWYTEAKKIAPISLRMAIAWAHEDGRVVNVPLEDLKTLRGSMAESELRGEKFFPVQVLSIIPDELNGVKIRAIPIPPLGTAERILAAQAMPAAVQAFARQAKADGIVGETELH